MKGDGGNTGGTYGCKGGGKFGGKGGKYAGQGKGGKGVSSLDTLGLWDLYQDWSDTQTWGN